MDEREQDGWLGPTLRQTPVPASGACFDAETLGAWCDGGLSAKASAAVELHASTCARCTAVLTEIARSAPAAPAVSARHAWTSARMFRWLAPLAAAATAVAIWVAVPDRPIAPVQPLPSHDLATPESKAGTGGTREPERRIMEEERSSQSLEPRAQPAPSARMDKPAAEATVEMRDEFRRGRAASDSMAATPESAPPPPPAAPAPAAAADTLAASPALNAQRFSLNNTAMSAESTSVANPLIHWRIAAPVSIERSTDGGKTWTRTTSPASTVASIRAVDGDRAVAGTSDGAQFYTTDGGRSWTRVQENSAAPF